MSAIDRAVAWAVSIANDDSHGYDQYGRWGPDYDCSSLVISAWENAGVPVKTKGATRTTNMCSVFIKCGFADVTKSVNLKTGAGLQKGDVLWRTGHTEMMCSATHRVGAHSSENKTITGKDGDQTGQEIDIRKYSGTWERVLRYPGGSDETELPTINKTDLICSNKYLSLSQMYNNAVYIASWLMNRGWTMEAVSALLGNMQTESTINPGIWESLNEGNTSRGFGLVQWTPATKLIDWATENGFDYTDIDVQLSRILWERDNGVQYYPTDSYPETFHEFTVSEKSPEYLAAAFLYNYERPKSPSPETRGNQARYWYTILSSIDPDWLMNLVTPKKKRLSLVLMYAALRGGLRVV